MRQTSTRHLTMNAKPSYQSCPCKPSGTPKLLFLTFSSNLLHPLPTLQLWAVALSKYFILKQKHSDSLFCPRNLQPYLEMHASPPPYILLELRTPPWHQRPISLLELTPHPQSLCEDVLLLTTHSTHSTSLSTQHCQASKHTHVHLQKTFALFSHTDEESGHWNPLWKSDSQYLFGSEMCRA